MSYLNNIGDTHSYKLCFLTIKVLMLLKQHQDLFTVKLVADVNSIKVDYISRFSYHLEYALHQTAFFEFTHLIPFQLEEDLFASPDNNKLEQFVSLNDSKSVIAVDAFSNKLVMVIWHIHVSTNSFYQGGEGGHLLVGWIE